MKKQRWRYLLVLVCGLMAACGKKTAETKPIRKDVTESVFASGVLEAQGTYNLTAQADGYLRDVRFQEGDVIQAGSVLAVVDNKENVFNTESAERLYQIAKANTTGNAPAIAQARVNIGTARDKMRLDSVQAARYERLYAANSIARTDYEQAALQYRGAQAGYESAVEGYQMQKQQTQQVLISARARHQVSGSLAAYNSIRALVGGRIYKKQKQTGDFVRKGDVIAVIGDAEVLYAKVSVDETNIGKVAIGQKALVQLNTSPGKTYSGKVAEIYPAFDEATQSFFCKILFDAPIDFRISGTQLQTNIVIAEHPHALLIPRAYLDFGGRVRIKGNDALLKVKTGFVSNEWVEVLSGIDDNATLTTDDLTANNVKTSEAGASLRR